MKNNVPVVLISDNNYVVPTAVAIQSLLDHYKKEECLEIYIISNGIDEGNKSRFLQFNGDKAQIHMLEFDGNMLSAFNEDGYYVTGTALVKFCIPRLLPEYDKILYIDGDVLIQDDITELTEVNVEGYFAAAIADMAAMAWSDNRFHKRLHLIRYFNSGVLLLNAKRIRDEGVEEKLFAVKKKHPEYMCMDQDVFNDVFHDEVRFMPQRWNLMMYNFRICGFSLNQVNLFYHSDYSSWEEMEKDACLIHLTNEYKPWKYKDAYQSEQWQAVFQRCPFSGEELELLSINKAVVNASQGHILTRKGPFVKDWSESETAILFLGIPIARKIKQKHMTKFAVLGIPVLKRMWDTYEKYTTVLGIRMKRKPNYAEIWQKITDDFAILNNSVDGILASHNFAGEISRASERSELMAQISRLKQYENARKQHEDTI